MEESPEDAAAGGPIEPPPEEQRRAPFHLASWALLALAIGGILAGMPDAPVQLDPTPDLTARWTLALREHPFRVGVALALLIRALWRAPPASPPRNGQKPSL